jgi:hypothetical protein
MPLFSSASHFACRVGFRNRGKRYRAPTTTATAGLHRRPSANAARATDGRAVILVVSVGGEGDAPYAIIGIAGAWCYGVFASILAKGRGVSIRSQRRPSARRDKKQTGIANVDDGETAIRGRPSYQEPTDDEQGPISQEVLRGVAEEVRSAFPRRLSVPELVLIDVDPHHLFAFWNLPFDRVEAALSTVRESGEPDPPMVLRLSHSDGHEPFDVEVQGLQGQTYVDIWEAHRNFRGELGFRLADGSLLSLVEGVDVTLPALGPAGEATIMIEVPAPLHGRAAPRPADRRQAAVAVRDDATARPIEAATAASTAAADHALPRPPMSEGIATPPREGEAGMPLAAGDGSQGPQIDAGAAAAAAAPSQGQAAGAGEGPTAPLDLENALTLSSFVLGRETVQLEVNAELRVFGRARPGSELKLFGRRVALRPDGSFSITRPLPNGALVLTALLAQGEGD